MKYKICEECSEQFETIFRDHTTCQDCEIVLEQYAIFDN